MIELRAGKNKADCSNPHKYFFILDYRIYS